MNMDLLNEATENTITNPESAPTIESQNVVADEATIQIHANDDERQSQASALVDFVLSEAELFHDLNQEVYARYNSTQETYRLDSRRFNDWAIASFFQKTKKAVSEQSFRVALGTLSGLARQNDKCHEVHIRVALYNGNYYIDLAEPGSSRAIELRPGDWCIVNKPPCYFIRPETMRPLPYPTSGHSIEKLWDLINIPKDSRYLVLAWLADSLRPDTPFPILELFGEQGSAKSTTQRLLRQLIDPNASDLRAAPKTPEDVFVCAGVNWLASYENISHLSPQMQDAFCSLSTGAGYAKRKLYSDSDESVIQVKRPIVLNGISISVTAQDLVDRTVSIETPIISERMEIKEIIEIFESIKGQLLGSLLDLTAKALEILPVIKLPPEERPRLIEFAYLGMAISEIMEGNDQAFLSQFNAAKLDSIARTIDSMPVASAIIDLCDDHTHIEQSAKDLLESLDRYKPAHTDKWPQSAKGLGDALRRAAPALRQLGIECRSLGKRGSNVYWGIKVRR